MIGRFLSLTIFLIVAIGGVLHFEIDIPGFSTWIGHLPGDLILKKGKATIFLPFTTAAMIGAVLSLISSLLLSKES